MEAAIMTKQQNNKEPKQQAAQQKYMELQMINNQAKELQKQIQALENQVGEVDSILNNLDEMKNINVGSEILVPVANGIFLKAELKDSQNLKVNVGGNTVVVRTIDETKKLLGDQSIEIREVHDQLATQLKKIIEHAEKTEEELKQMVQEIQQ